MPKKKRLGVTRSFAKKSATAATASAVLSAVSLLSASLGVSVGSDKAFAASHLKEGTITHRKAGKGQQEYLQTNQQKLQTNQQKLQSNQQKLPSMGHSKR